MEYTKVREQLIWNLRLDFEPVGVSFVYDKSLESGLPITHRAKAKITYCQFLTAARQSRMAFYMKPEKLLCQNAWPVFNFRDLEQEADTKRHLKYLIDKDLAWEAVQQKARLKKGCKGIYIAPIDFFDKAEIKPDLLFMICTPYQAYHILNDYMGGMKKPNLSFFHTPNSAVCSGSVWAFNNNTANMTTMCAGSKTSGKTEMAYLNVFIPGKHIKPFITQQQKRIAMGEGASLLGKGSQPWPGLDVCKGCPLFKFEAV
ncbi:DUF169 domain-containing protein [Desulfonauticus submarinus]